MALLRVGRQGGLSSCKVYTRLLVWLESDQFGFVYFYYFYSNTLGICFQWLISRVWSGHLLEGYAPLLRVLYFLSVSDVFGGVSKVVSKYFQ